MNNRAVSIIAGVAAGTAALALLAGTMGLNLSGARLIAFCSALTALIAAAAGVVLWMKSARGESAPAEPPAGAAPAGGAQADSIFAEAEKRLRRIQASFDTRPVLFVLGPAGSAKTSTLLNCGLTVEPLGGQPGTPAQTVPTQTANLLLIRDTIAVDAAGALLNDSASWTKLVARFRPKVRSRDAEAPRSALLCIPCDELLRGVDAMQALAQTVRARLEDAAETLGVRFPVYVLFTRTDRIRFFTEYVAGLTEPEALNQVLGASFRTSSEENAGLYADEAERKFGGAFDTLFGALASGRVEQLARTESVAHRPAVYEFPREFAKLRPAVVRLLTELDRPSQLVMAPFVRGFYFSGVRPIITEIVTQPAETRQRERPAAAGDATTMFRAGGTAPQPAIRSGPTLVKKRVPQWVFLRPLFDRVLLNDPVARRISAGSVHVSRRLRFAYIGAIAACTVAAALVVGSLVANRSLIAVPRDVGQAAAQSAPAGTPSVEQLRELDKLRAQLVQMEEWRASGRPLHMGWGLYTGGDLAEPATAIYFRRFGQLLWEQVRSRNSARLRGLPPVRRDGDEYTPAYDALKASLVMTSEYRRPPSDWQTDWLSGWLFKEWSGLNGGASPEVRRLAQEQFNFYAARLRQSNPFSTNEDTPAVRAARAHLSSFSNIDQIYNRLRAQASAASQPVRFAAIFPEAAEVVTNNYTVDGAWTAKGWAAMMKSLNEEKFGGEEWVLGQRALPIQNPAQLRADIAAAYTRDYIAQWTQYLRRTSVVPYKSPPDAASKLRILSHVNSSPLLASLWLASQHTAVDDAVRREFGAVHAVVPHAPDGTRNFVTPASQQYTGELSSLAGAIDMFVAAGDRSAATAQLQIKANESRQMVRNMAGVLPRGTEDTVVRAVASVLEEPITQFSVPDPAREAAAAMNGAGQAFCRQWNAVAAKYPFRVNAASEASIAEIASVFARPSGHLAKLEAALGGALQPSGTGWAANPAAPVKLNPRFVAFVDTVARLGRAMFPKEGMTEPQMAVSLRWHASDQITAMTVSLEGQSVSYQGAVEEVKTLVWRGTPTGEVGIRYVVKGGSRLEPTFPAGPWSLFRFLDDAKETSVAEGAMRLTWIESGGRSGSPTRVDGKPLTYQFTVEPGVLAREARTRIQCVPEVTAR
jgi:type VI secretion system protein ImpL